MSGSIQLPFFELIQGIIEKNHEEAAVVYDLRFPRIIVAGFAGAALAVSGALLQAVMRNPLADASIIGISSGANLTALIAVTIMPQWFYFMPMFAFIGGLFACFLVYTLSWRGGLSPLHLILVGIALHATFTGLSEAFNYRGSYSVTSISSATTSTLSMKTWGDANVMMIYGGIALIAAMGMYAWCNLLSLDDRTTQTIGLSVKRTRIIVSIIAVILAATATAIAGLIAFLGLLIPHISRQFLGSDYKTLLPFSALAGALLLISADTFGRTIIAPNEIPASIMMAIIGGPFLIFLLRKSERIHEHS